MNNQNNFTREDIAESLHSDFGLTKRDCIIFVNDIIDIIIEMVTMRHQLEQVLLIHLMPPTQEVIHTITQNLINLDMVLTTIVIHTSLKVYKFIKCQDTDILVSL